MEFLSSSKTFLALGSLFGFLAVAIGAFGAHALKQKLSDEFLTIFEVGVRYQMYHALLLVMIGMLLSVSQNGYIETAGWLLVFGIIIFSGSLYTLTLTGIKILGAITPIGGLLLLLGWAALLIGVFKK